MPDSQMQPQGQRPGQPPFGSSPAVGPTQNQGYQAQGIAVLQMVVSLLEKSIPMLGAGSEPGQDALDALRKLAKHIPPGAANQAAQNNQLQSLMLKRAQMGGMMQQPQQQAQPAPQQMQAAA